MLTTSGQHPLGGLQGLGLPSSISQQYASLKPRLGRSRLRASVCKEAYSTKEHNNGGIHEEVASSSVGPAQRGRC